MYRIAIKYGKSLKFGLKELTLQEARIVKNKLGKKCIIVTEKYFEGKEKFKEIL